MATTKKEKRNNARKLAELNKAKKKAARNAKVTVENNSRRKGKSAVAQSKKKK